MPDHYKKKPKKRRGKLQEVKTPKSGSLGTMKVPVNAKPKPKNAKPKSKKPTAKTGGKKAMMTKEAIIKFQNKQAKKTKRPVEKAKSRKPVAKGTRKLGKNLTSPSVNFRKLDRELATKDDPVSKSTKARGARGVKHGRKRSAGAVLRKAIGKVVSRRGRTLGSILSALGGRD